MPQQRSPYGPRKFTSVTAYHRSFPKRMQEQLQSFHALLKQLLPDAEECISYNMPAFRKGKVLVYYAGCKTHIGFYPTPGPIAALKAELNGYKTSKGAIQIPLDKAMPLMLLKKIIAHRLAEIETGTRSSLKKLQDQKRGHKL